MTRKNRERLRQKIQNLAKPLVIFICGMPGTRKSSTAILLAAALRFKIMLGTDQIRDIVRAYSDDPFLAGPTHDRWKLVGERTPKNIIFGYAMQCAIIKKAVMETLKLSRRGENMILEGVHLFPLLYYSEMTADPDICFRFFLLRLADRKLHEKNIAGKVGSRHGKEKRWPEEKLEDIREIQNYIFLHKLPGVHVVDSTDPEKNLEKILEILDGTL